MKGWSEEEFRNRDLMAPCGLYCGVCGVYIATRDNNTKFKEALGNLYGTKPEETECLGCMQSDPPKNLYTYCRLCPIRTCITSKGFYSCHQCDQWPCDLIEKFSFATGVQVMKRSIPIWREKVAEHGDQEGSVQWARYECGRYHCPYCGEPLFGAHSSAVHANSMLPTDSTALCWRTPRTIDEPSNSHHMRRDT